MLRAALIVALALVTPASADLWTGTPGSNPQAPARPTPGSIEEAPRAPAPPDWTLVAIVDPACPITAGLAEDLSAFAREHRDVAVEVRLTRRPSGSREAIRALAVLAESGVPVIWSPGATGQPPVPTLPALSLRDAQGRGARAAGRPPLETLWRAARRATR